MSERVVFFSPHAGVWQHSFPEALVAEAVKAHGGDVTYVSCNGALSHCVTMSAHGVRAEDSDAAKARVCVACRRSRDVILDTFGFRGYDMESVLTDADEARVQSIADSANPAAIGDLVVDGVRVGQSTLYEYLIAQKRMITAFTDIEWVAFRPRLVNALRSLFAAQRVFDREKPTRFVAYNTLYSVIAVWRAVADQRGIPVFVLHAGPNLAYRLSTILVGRDSTTKFIYHLIDKWSEHGAVPAHPDEIARVTDHFCEVLQGRNVFSYSARAAGADVREKLGVTPGQKMLVATLSSYDEYVAARAVGEQPDESTLLFPRQVDWIRALVDYVRTRPDLFLVIRVHPREFPNKREGATSQHAKLLERELVDLPPNARVNWPADKISLWDLAEYADVILNAWSTAGKEMALLGLPVIVYCPTLLMYAPQINIVAQTHETYFAAIESALQQRWNFGRIRLAYRWCAIEYARAIADISDGFRYDEVAPITLVQRAKAFLLTLPYVRQVRDIARKPSHIAEQPRIAATILGGHRSLLDATLRRTTSIDDETRALNRDLARLVGALYPGATGSPPPGSLRELLTTALSDARSRSR